jgi:hypothetical protein
LVLQSSSVMKANSMASETWRIGDRLWDLREISSVWAEASHVFRCMKMLKLLGISTARLDGSHGVVCKKKHVWPRDWAAPSQGRAC